MIWKVSKKRETNHVSVLLEPFAEVWSLKKKKKGIREEIEIEKGKWEKNEWMIRRRRRGGDVRPSWECLWGRGGRGSEPSPSAPRAEPGTLPSKPYFLLFSVLLRDWRKNAKGKQPPSQTRHDVVSELDQTISTLGLLFFKWAFHLLLGPIFTPSFVYASW